MKCSRWKLVVVAFGLLPALGCGTTQSPIEPSPAVQFGTDATAVKPSVKPKERIALNRGSEVTVENPEGGSYIRITVDLKGTSGFRVAGTAGDLGFPWPAFLQCEPQTEGCAPGTAVDASLPIFPGSVSGEASVRGQTFEIGGMMGGIGVVGTTSEMNMQAQVILPPAPAVLGSTVTVSTPFTMTDAALGVPTPDGEWPIEWLAFGARSRPSGQAVVTLEWKAFEFSTGTPAWAVTSVRYLFH